MLKIEEKFRIQDVHTGEVEGKVKTVVYQMLHFFPLFKNHGLLTKKMLLVGEKLEKIKCKLLRKKLRIFWQEVEPPGPTYLTQPISDEEDQVDHAGKHFMQKLYHLVTRHMLSSCRLLL